MEIIIILSVKAKKKTICPPKRIKNNKKKELKFLKSFGPTKLTDRCDLHLPPLGGWSLKKLKL